MTEDEDYRKAVLSAFITLMESMSDPDSVEEALYQLAELRSGLGIACAIDGFDMDPEIALDLIKTMDTSTLTDEEKEKRRILIAAVNNIIDFSVCEEYQLYKDVEDELPEYDFDSGETIPVEDEDFMAPYLVINEKYNTIYSNVENADIEYAMAVAASWIKYPQNIMLTYMTQNDDRVRPWHFALQGFTASKSDFPSWMIPPIEWACRCYLVDTEGEPLIGGKINAGNIKAKADVPKKPDQLDGIFKESVCKGERIFSDEHPYFQVDDSDQSMLSRIVERIRERYYG